MSKKRSSNIFLIIVIIVVILAAITLAAGRSTLFCKYITKYKTEEKIEEYTSSVKNCDSIANCNCLHKGLLGLGACDSCNCRKRVEQQVPYEEKVCPWD